MHKCFIWLLRKTKKKMTTQPAMVYHALHKGTWKKKYDIILDEDRKNKWTNLARTKTTPNLCKCKLYLVSSKIAHLRFFFIIIFLYKKNLSVNHTNQSRNWATNQFLVLRLGAKRVRFIILVVRQTLANTIFDCLIPIKYEEPPRTKEENVGIYRRYITDI